MRQFEIPKPYPFNFQECLHFLSRSDNECMHRVEANRFSRLKYFNGEAYLFSVEEEGANLLVTIHRYDVPPTIQAFIKSYVCEWLDINGELEAFYKFAKSDRLLAPLCNRFHGLRLIGIPDLFEALSWAIIGQQINLRFAYQIKKKLVESYGQYFDYQGHRYYDFPLASIVAALSVDDLKALQFSRQKAEYLIGIAQLLESGELSKADLLNAGTEAATASLCAIRGIGNWTAQYVLLKCLLDKNAFPLQDVGLHQAIRNLSGMAQKPDIKMIEKITGKWEGWKGYATFYLWHSLLYE